MELWKLTSKLILLTRRATNGLWKLTSKLYTPAYISQDNSTILHYFESSSDTSLRTLKLIYDGCVTFHDGSICGNNIFKLSLFYSIRQLSFVRGQSIHLYTACCQVLHMVKIRTRCPDKAAFFGH